MNMIRRITILLTVLSFVFGFAACGKTTNAAEIQYTDYAFWQQENVVRIAIPEIKSMGLYDKSEGVTGTGELKLKKKYLERTEVLKAAIISYFNEEYDIDVSETLAKQELRAFKVQGVNEGTMGYVDYENPKYLNLNEKLFSEYKILFDNTYVHETIHQLGFRDKNAPMIVEGFVEALTDAILKKAEIASFLTPTYETSRLLAEQVLLVDKDIARFFLKEENPDIVSRINNVLEAIERPLEKKQDVGCKLEDLVNGLTYGLQTTIDISYIAFEAQEIVRAYCQEFKPTEDQINSIREKYILLDYEFVDVQPFEGGYNFIVKE